jgi:hypothetical protein
MIPSVTDLLNGLNNTIYRTSFYASCVEYLKRLDNKGLPIYEIFNDAPFLEALRLHFIKNEPKLMYLSADLPDREEINYAYRLLPLTDKSRRNLIIQLNAIKSQSMKALCTEDKIPVEPISYVIFTDTIIADAFQIPANYASISLLLGVKSIEVLEYQNIERLCGYINTDNANIQKELKPLFDFYDFHNNVLTLDEKERILVFSGCVLTVLGTVYTNDVDLMYIALGSNGPNIGEFKQKIKTNKDYDAHFIFKDHIEKTASNRVRSYLFDWFTKGWPLLEGANSIFDVVADPRYHFHFMGIKFISLELTVKRIQKRAYSSAYVDLLMLERYNDYKAKICFPNLSIREGVITVYDDKMIDSKIKKIQKNLKEWHQIDMSFDELKNKIYKCRDKPFEIYETRPLRNKFTNEIIAYHTNVMNYYIDNYLDKEKLLDIGAGPLRQVEYYEKIGFKHLVAVEPSTESIKTGMERYQQKVKNLKLDFIEGIGDEQWLNSETYAPVNAAAPYKSILFKFTIHYMIKNIDILLDNLSGVITPNTTIVISCIDGTKLMNEMRGKGKYEIFLGDDPLYGAFEFPSKDDTDVYKQIMIYFKGVYGVESGSIEYIVDLNYLINKFASIGFKAILSKNFMEINVPQLVKMRSGFNEAQKKVSSLHHLLILRNGNGNGNGNDNNNEKISSGGYERKYKKYKTKYLREKPKKQRQNK